MVFLDVAGATLEVLDQDGNRPLHLAAYAGHSEIVSLFIEGGAKYKRFLHHLLTINTPPLPRVDSTAAETETQRGAQCVSPLQLSHHE